MSGFSSICGKTVVEPRTRIRAGEAGFTLPEMLASMTILLVVLGGILTPLVSATKAQVDLTTRFQNQETARLALGTFQRDVHCATGMSPTSGATTTVTFTLLSGCETGTGSVTWCAVPGTTLFDLWRIPAGTCSTSTTGSRRWAQSLTSQSVFTPDATVHAGAPVSPSVQLALAVKTGRSTYKLTTSVYSRSAARQ